MKTARATFGQLLDHRAGSTTTTISNLVAPDRRLARGVEPPCARSLVRCGSSHINALRGDMVHELER
jgi:hypothetical protein